MRVRAANTCSPLWQQVSGTTELFFTPVISMRRDANGTYIYLAFLFMLLMVEVRDV